MKASSSRQRECRGRFHVRMFKSEESQARSNMIMPSRRGQRPTIRGSRIKRLTATSTANEKLEIEFFDRKGTDSCEDESVTSHLLLFNSSAGRCEQSHLLRPAALGKWTDEKGRSSQNHINHSSWTGGGGKNLQVEETVKRLTATAAPSGTLTGQNGGNADPSAQWPTLGVSPMRTESAK